MQVLRLFALALALLSTILAQGGGFGSGSATNPFSTADSTRGSGPSAGWRPWVTVNGNYVGSIKTSLGLADFSSAQGSASGGVGGSKQWGTRSLAGGYTASVSYNPASSQIAKWRPTQVANLSYGQQISQRLKFSLSQLGGMSYGGYGVAAGFGITGVPGTASPYGAGGLGSGSEIFGDPSQNGIVDGEVFDGRTRFYTANGSLSYLFSERLALSFSGGGNLVRRSQGLQGNTSYHGSVSLDYRLTRRAAVMAGSSYSTNTYNGYFGSVRSLFHNVGVGYQISPTIDLSVQGGAGQIVSTFIGVVALPPEVAEILGVSGSLAVQETRSWSPSYNINITKRAQFGSFMAGISRGFTPGNGVVMAGVRDIAVVGFSRIVSSRIGVGLTSSATHYSGRVGVLASTESAQAGANVSIRIISGLSLGINCGARYVGVPSQSHRSDVFFGGGFSWAPGERPFTF